VKFDTGNFRENLSKKITLLTKGQKYRALYMKTYVSNKEETLEISGLEGEGEM